jgi:TonB family protein
MGLLLPGWARAQLPSYYSEWQSLKIIQTTEPLFPHEVQQRGLKEGETRVVINVDPDGKLKEWLVVGYTMPEFATAAVVALKQWKFEPARWRGDSVGTVLELIFHFETKGTMVISQSVSEALESITVRLMERAYVFRTCSLRELDRIPTPITTVRPQYSSDLAAKGVKGKVTVDFFIDETGSVRMPAVSINDDVQLTALAIDALRQWKFEPPTRNGRPALVKAVQVFSFGSEK